MREIKFRCWRDGYMCTYYPQWRFVHNGIYFEEEDAVPEKIGDGEPVLLQYTGLKDKNGVEIYEGDLLSWRGFDEFVVEWQEILVDGGGAVTGWNTSSHYTKDCEVRGNIYENPELVEAMS